MLKELFMVKRLQKYNFYLECANICKKKCYFVNLTNKISYKAFKIPIRFW